MLIPQFQPVPLEPGRYTGKILSFAPVNAKTPCVSIMIALGNNSGCCFSGLLFTSFFSDIKNPLSALWMQVSPDAPSAIDTDRLVGTEIEFELAENWKNGKRFVNICKMQMAPNSNPPDISENGLSDSDGEINF